MHTLIFFWKKLLIVFYENIFKLYFVLKHKSIDEICIFFTIYQSEIVSEFESDQRKSN